MPFTESLEYENRKRYLGIAEAPWRHAPHGRRVGLASGTARRSWRPGRGVARVGTRRSLASLLRRPSVRPPAGACTFPASGRADLPERILLHDQAVAERPQVAATDLDPLALGRGPGQGPLRGPAVAVHEVRIALVADIRDAREARGEGLANRLATNDAHAPRLGATRPLEHRIVREVGHDAVKVVLVEGRRDGLEHPYRRVVIHVLLPPRPVPTRTRRRRPPG